MIFWCLPSLVFLARAIATGNPWDVSIGMAARATFVVLSAYIQLSFRMLNSLSMDILEAFLVLSLPFAACFILWFAVRSYETGTPLALNRPAVKRQLDLAREP